MFRECIPETVVRLLVYAVGPLLVPLAYWRNERYNAPPGPADVRLAQPLRLALVVAGALFTILGILLFVNPALFIPVWPWQLTPLIGRVIAAWIFLPGLGAVAAYYEPRYLAYRPLLQLSLIWGVLVLIGSLFHLDDFDFGRPLAWLWFAYLVVIIPVLLAVRQYHERRPTVDKVVPGTGSAAG